MEITQQPQQTVQVPRPTASTTAEQVNSDFEMFLQMLTAQMKNQDPLNPVDSTDYATQLATFSGVEQAVLTNDLLKSLTTQMNAGGLVDMAALVGKEVRSTAPADFDGQPLTLYPTQPTTADQVELIVRNQAGDEVQRVAVPRGADTIDWAGVVPGGSPMPAGTYQFEVIGTTNGEIISQSPVETYGTVQEVRMEAGKTMLFFAGGASVESSQVTALREARS